MSGSCSCGQLIGQCPFWEAVRARMTAEGWEWAEVVTASSFQAHVLRFPKTLLAKAADPAWQRLTEMTLALQTAIQVVSGRPHLVDSSKEPTRALFLARCHPDLRLIRLVRDPCSSVASHYWRLKQRGYFHFLRKDRRVHPALSPLLMLLAAASWTVGNLLADVAANAASRRAFRLRYEDLRDAPERAIGDLARFLGVDLAETIATLRAGAPVKAGHVIDGNGIRLHRGLRFDPGWEATRPTLPLWLRLCTVALCWPLMLRYGYLAFPRQRS